MHIRRSEDVLDVLYTFNLRPCLEHCVKSVQIMSFFWSVFCSIRTEFGHFSRSGGVQVNIIDFKKIWRKFISNHIKYQMSQPTITCSKLTIETLAQLWNMFKVNKVNFIVNFEHISHLVLVFLLLTLSR